MESELSQIELVTLRQTLNRRLGAKKIMKMFGIDHSQQIHIAKAFIPKPALTARPFANTPISEREKQIIILLCNGLSCQEIADYLFVSYNTIKKHVANIYDKTGCRNRAELYTYAFTYNII